MNRKLHKEPDVLLASAGTVAGALGAGLAASGAVVPWLRVLPEWGVFLGGALVCGLTAAARLWRARR